MGPLPYQVATRRSETTEGMMTFTPEVVHPLILAFSIAFHPTKNDYLDSRLYDIVDQSNFTVQLNTCVTRYERLHMVSNSRDFH
jgi:hypothetical protein